MHQGVKMSSDGNTMSYVYMEPDQELWNSR